MREEYGSFVHLRPVLQRRWKAIRNMGMSRDQGVFSFTNASNESTLLCARQLDATNGE
jgi:hypothetical protein